MKQQQFHKGDLVHVIKDLGPFMSHFTSDIDAIVIGSYADQFGGNNTNDYTLHLKDRGECSWYCGYQLELIEPNRLDLLETWKAKQQSEIDTKSDLDWIFQNGNEVIKQPHGASLQALADSLDLGSLWGSHGEGITYYIRSHQILAVAAPYLEKGDKAGWLALKQQVIKEQHLEL